MFKFTLIVRYIYLNLIQLWTQLLRAVQCVVLQSIVTTQLASQQVFEQQTRELEIDNQCVRYLTRAHFKRGPSSSNVIDKHFMEKGNEIHSSVDVKLCATVYNSISVLDLIHSSTVSTRN